MKLLALYLYNKLIKSGLKLKARPFGTNFKCAAILWAYIVRYKEKTRQYIFKQQILFLIWLTVNLKNGFVM